MKKCIEKRYGRSWLMKSILSGTSIALLAAAGISAAAVVAVVVCVVVFVALVVGAILGAIPGAVVHAGPHRCLTGLSRWIGPQARDRLASPGLPPDRHGKETTCGRKRAGPRYIPLPPPA